MGMTHHLHGVANVEAIANLALLRGMIGRALRRPAAAARPFQRAGHRHHRRQAGAGRGVLARMEQAFGITLPREQGLRHHGRHAGGRSAARSTPPSSWAATSGAPRPTPTSPRAPWSASASSSSSPPRSIAAMSMALGDGESADPAGHGARRGVVADDAGIDVQLRPPLRWRHRAARQCAARNGDPRRSRAAAAAGLADRLQGIQGTRARSARPSPKSCPAWRTWPTSTSPSANSTSATA